MVHPLKNKWMAHNLLLTESKNLMKDMSTTNDSLTSPWTSIYLTWVQGRLRLKYAEKLIVDMKAVQEPTVCSIDPTSALPRFNSPHPPPSLHPERLQSPLLLQIPQTTGRQFVNIGIQAKEERRSSLPRHSGGQKQRRALMVKKRRVRSTSSIGMTHLVNYC